MPPRFVDPGREGGSADEPVIESERLSMRIEASLGEAREVQREIARAQSRLHALIDGIRRLDDERDLARRAEGASVRPDTTMRHRSLRAEIATGLRLTERAVDRLMSTGHALAHDLPGVGAAFAAGDLTQRHVDVLVDELGGLQPPVRAVLERELLPLAGATNPAQLSRKTRELREARNPDDAAARHRGAMAERGVFVTDGRDGMASITVCTDAARVHAAKDRVALLARPLLEHDARTSHQLQADLAMEALLTGGAGDGSGRHVVPTVLITVPALTLLGHDAQPATLEGYGPIDIETAARYVADAPSFRRVLTDPHTAAPLSFERTRYRVDGALRDALILMGRVCGFPGCNAKASLADADHIVEWQHEGRTALGNLTMLCRGHHTLKGIGAWTYRRAGDGDLSWTAPNGRTVLRPAETPALPLRIDGETAVVDDPADDPPPRPRGEGGGGDDVDLLDLDPDDPGAAAWCTEYLDDLADEWEADDVRNGPGCEPVPGFLDRYLRGDAWAAALATEIDDVEALRVRRCIDEGREYAPLGYARALEHTRRTRAVPAGAATTAALTGGGAWAAAHADESGSESAPF